MASLEGRVLAGRYQIESPIGSGGMGTVYAAIHLDLARPVAVKVLDRVGSPKDLERFAAEALAAASLSNPHIVQVTDYVAETENEPAFLVMERLRGQSLATILRTRDSLPPKLAVRITLQLLDALGAAHEAGIIHRDIKPGNVFVLDGADPDRPWVKLIDFGIAKIADFPSSKTTTGMVLGTHAYLAPEVLAGGRATKESDLYAVGIVLGKMLERPDAALAAIIAKATAHDPAQRFHFVREMAQALRAPRRSSTGPSRWPLFALAFALTTVACVATAILLSRRDGGVPRQLDAAIATTTASVPDAESPLKVASTPADADAAAPEPTDASVSKQAGLRKSICVLSTAFSASRPFEALCPLPVVYYCECTVAGYPIFATKEAKTPLQEYRPSGDDGNACSGWTVRDGEERTADTGRWHCSPNCDLPRIRSSARLAVPGSPCVGWQTGGTWKGVWKAVD